MTYGPGAAEALDVLLAVLHVALTTMEDASAYDETLISRNESHFDVAIDSWMMRVGLWPVCFKSSGSILEIILE